VNCICIIYGAVCFIIANNIVLRSFVDPEIVREHVEVEGYMEKAVERWREEFLPLGFPCTLYKLLN
jgi:hypothetical protein